MNLEDLRRHRTQTLHAIARAVTASRNRTELANAWYRAPINLHAQILCKSPGPQELGMG